MKIKNPLGLNIVVMPDESESETKSGIIIPDTAKDRNKPNTGKVISVGEAVTTLKAGDKILYGKFAGVQVDLEKQNLLIMKANDVFAVIED